ncbi:10071_t:CDS:2, partial [Cetraspora pellucida]
SRFGSSFSSSQPLDTSVDYLIIGGVGLVVAERLSKEKENLPYYSEPFRDSVIKEETEYELDRFVKLVGIESPGLTSSLAIAKMVDNNF